MSEPRVSTEQAGWMADGLIPFKGNDLACDLCDARAAVKEMRDTVKELVDMLDDMAAVLEDPTAYDLVAEIAKIEALIAKHKAAP